MDDNDKTVQGLSHATSVTAKFSVKCSVTSALQYK